MAEATVNDRKALIRRVDELAQRQQQEHEEVPLLTEIVDPVAVVEPGIPAQELEALAKRLEQAVLEQLVPEVELAIEAAHDSLKSEISASIRRAVREALAAQNK